MKSKQLRFRSRSFPTQVCFSFGLAAYAAVGFAQSLQAADGTWTSTATPGLWSNAANWSGGIIADGSGFTATFGSDITADTTVNLDSARIIGNLVFSDPTVTTAGSWILANNANAANILTLAGASAPTITVNALGTAKNATISLVLAGNQGFTKAGTGSLVLSGANTISGSIILNAGTLVLNNATALGTTDLTINAGTILDSTVAGITLTANNVQSWNGDFTFTGTQSLNLGTGAVTLNANRLVTVTGNTLTVGGAIGGGAFSLTKAGGGTLALAGANTYSGQSIVNAGTLRFANTAALYGGNSANWTEANINVKSGAIIAFNVGGAGEFSTANITSLLTNLAVSSSATTGLNAGANISFDTTNAAGGTFTIADIIANTTGASGGSLGVQKLGVNTLILSGANTYTGTTVVNAGTLQITGLIGSSTTRAGAITANNAGILNINGGTVFGTSANNAGTGGASTISVTAGTFDLSGTLSINSSNSSQNHLGLFTGGTTNVNAIVIGRAGSSLTALTVAGATTYGVYVNGGTVNVATTLQIGSAATGVNSNSNMRIDSGSVTVAGVTTVSTNNNNGRPSVLDINGGTFTSTDTVGAGIQVGGVGNTNGGNGELLIRGGVVNTNKITLGTATQVSGANTLLIRGGTTYIGAGGIVTLGTTVIPLIELGGVTGGAAATAPVLAASADWSSSVNIILANSSTAVTPTFQAADASNVAHNITLSGILSGAGGLTKTGGGTLTLTGVNTYLGLTSVNAGKLVVGNAGVGSLAGAVNIGAAGNLGGTGTINGLVTTTSGATIDLGDNAIGILNLNAGLTLNGNNSLKFDYDTVTNTSDRINVTGAVNALGSNTVTINSLGAGTVVVGDHTLISAGSGINASNFTLATTTLGGENLSLNSSTSNALILTVGSLGSGNATAYWKGGASGTWAPANFSVTQDGLTANTLIDGATDVFFSADAPVPVATTTTLAADQAVRSLTIRNNQTDAVSISGTQKFTIGSGGITLQGSAGALTISTNEVALGGIQNWSNQSTNGVTVNAPITGATAGIKFTGGGTGGFTLTGVNTYAAGTTIGDSSTGSAILRLTGAGALASTGAVSISLASTLDISGITAAGTSIGTLNTLGAGTGAQILLGAKTLTVNQAASATYAGVIGGTGGGLTKAGTGTLTLTGANTYDGLTFINVGALNIQNAAALGATTGGTTVASGAALELQGGVTVGAEALTLNGAGNGTNTGALRSISGINAFGGLINLASASRINTDLNSLTLGGNITNGGFDLTVGGAGNTIVTGAISGTGGLIKDGAGILTLAGTNTYTGATTITTGTLQLGNGTTDGTIANTSGVANSGVLNYNWANNHTAGYVISGTGSVTKTLAGVATLTGANSYSGVTTITTGAINIQNATALGATTGATTVAAGASLQIQGGITVGAEALTINGTGLSTLGALNSVSGNNTYGGAITQGSASRINSNTAGDTLTLTGNIGGAQALTIGGAGNVTASGVVGIAAGTLTKDGTGTLTLSGANTYTGATTISAGTLNVTGSLAATPVSIGAAGTLSGTGTIGGLVTASASGAQIDLRNNNTVSTLTLAGGLTLQAGNVLSFDLVGTTADTIAITGGTYTFNGTGAATVNINASGTNAVGTYALITGAAGINAANFVLSSGVVGPLGASLTVSGNTLNLQLSDSFGDANAYWKAGGTGTFAPASFSSNLDGTGTVTQLGNATNVYFSATTSAPAPVTATLSTNEVIKSLNVLANQTGAVTINGTGQLTIAPDAATSGLTVAAGAGPLTISVTGGVNLSSVQGWVNNSSNVVTVNSVLSGTALALSGPGGYVFTAANTYANGTAINGTTLTLTGAGSLFDSGAVSVNATGVFNISGITAASETIGDLTGAAGGSIVLGGKTLVVSAAGNTGAFGGTISGTGGLTKEGVGVLALTGVNTYTGATTVNNGILALGTGGSIVSSASVTIAGSGDLDISGSTGQTINQLSGSGRISLGAQTLTINEAAAGTYSGVIRDGGLTAGTGGGIIKAGAGTLTLSGASTYTGTTQINAGVLTLTGSLASGTVNVGTGTTFNVNGTLASTSTLTNDGTTVLNTNNTIGTFNNNSTLNGTAILTATTYNLNNNSVTNAQLGTGTINANGAVAINAATAAGTVNIQTGTTTLSATEQLADTAAVDITTGATLNLGGAEKIGTLAGAGTLNNAGFGLIVDGGTFSGNIGGTGGLTKTGSGTLSLTGAPTYTGATTVSAGILEVASLQSTSVSVSSGATFSNSGTVLGTVSLSGILKGLGTIQGLVTTNTGSTIDLTDNAAGTKTFSGGLSLANGTTVNLDLGNNGVNDQLNLAGTLFSASGTTTLNFTRITGSTLGGSYTIIAGASSGVDESFFVIGTPINGYQSNLTSDGTNLVLTLTQNTFAQDAITPNQIAVAQAIEFVSLNPDLFSDDFDNVIAALQPLSPEGRQAAFDQISPAFHSGALTLASGLSQATAGSLFQSLSARSMNSVDYSDPYAGDYLWDIWGQASGYFSDGGMSLIPGEDFKSGTYMVGANRNITHNTSIGVFGGYGDGTGDFADSSSIDLERQFVGGYLTYVNGGFYANAAVGGGNIDYDSKRRIQFGTLDRTATGSTSGEELFAVIGGGYDFKFGDFTVGPQASLQRSSVKLDGFNETGADSLNLGLADTEYTSLRSQVGGRMTYTLQTESSLAIVPFVQTFWQHEYEDSQDDIRSTLDGGAGPEFGYTSTQGDQDSFVFGAGLSFDVGETFQAVFSYNRDGGNGGSDTMSATANFKF